MDDIRVRKDELAARLTTNRAKHLADYETAIAGWRQQARAALLGKVAELEAGGNPSLDIPLRMPESHTGDYDTALDMLGMSVEAEIMISAPDFKRYVRDEWPWSGSFSLTNSQYSAH